MGTRGPKPYTPNAIDKARIIELVAVHASMSVIVERIGLSEVFLRRYYGEVFASADRQAHPRTHQPTDELRNKVRLLAGIGGVCLADIAHLLDISIGTLTKYYADDIKASAVDANMRVATNIYRMATGSPALKTTAAMAKWWSQSRMGWRDTTRTEITGPDGQPIKQEHQVSVILPDNGRDDTNPALLTFQQIDGEAVNAEDDEG